MRYDALLIGGGPAGLSAALTLGRARKRVLLCDAGPRRNAAAAHMHNFVTRDGATPDEFRSAARDQLARYDNVELRAAAVRSVEGARGAFRATLDDGVIEARRVLLCAGMVDVQPALEGLAELWGRSVFLCPYCHGWEVRDRPWGLLATSPLALTMMAPLLRGWTRSLTVFAQGSLAVDDDARAGLARRGVALEERALTRLVARDSTLRAVALADGSEVPCEALVVHPEQRPAPLLAGLGVALDEQGLVAVDALRRETSVPGIYAAGDLVTRAQSAIAAAASGTQAAAMLNHELTLELLDAGLL